jgi:hypothetical protein
LHPVTRIDSISDERTLHIRRKKETILVTLKILGRRRVLVGALVAAILLGVTSASVASASGRTPTQRAHPGSISHSALFGPPTAVFIAGNSADVTSTSTTLTAIPGMSLTFTVSHPARLLMHFTDEAGCAGPTAGNWCDVEILVDGVEAPPGAGTDYAIDTSDGSGTFKWVGGALNRNKKVAAGTHTVKVVFAPVFSGDTAWSGENSLEVWVF